MRREARGRNPGVLAAVALALALLLEPCWFLHVQQARVRAGEQEREALRAALARAREDGEAIAHLQPRLLALALRGVLGRDARLAWVEALREAGAVLALPTLRWRLEPPQPYRPTGIAAGVDVQASQLAIDVDLRRADELAPLLARLTAPHLGLITVRACGLDAVAPDGLHAHCVLERLTLSAVSP